MFLAWSGGLTLALFFQDSNYNNTIVEGDKHLVSKRFLLGTDTVFLAEMSLRVGRTDRMTDTSPRITGIFFPHISCQRHYQSVCYCLVL